MPPSLPILLASLILYACARGGPTREACWVAPETEEAPLTATTAEGLADRIARRSTHLPQPPPHDVELGACARPPLPAPDESALDDREREAGRLAPVVRQDDPRT